MALDYRNLLRHQQETINLLPGLEQNIMRNHYIRIHSFLFLTFLFFPSCLFVFCLFWVCFGSVWVGFFFGGGSFPHLSFFSMFDFRLNFSEQFQFYFSFSFLFGLFWFFPARELFDTACMIVRSFLLVSFHGYVLKHCPIMHATGSDSAMCHPLN